MIPCRAHDCGLPWPDDADADDDDDDDDGDDDGDGYCDGDNGGIGHKWSFFVSTRNTPILRYILCYVV